jgi:hypothetical protein
MEDLRAQITILTRENESLRKSQDSIKGILKERAQKSEEDYGRLLNHIEEQDTKLKVSEEENARFREEV